MRHTGHFKGGTKCVRLKLDIDEIGVLTSDFEDWYCVLNNWFCSDNEEEDIAFETGSLTISKQETWIRIFDLQRVRDPEWYGVGKRFLQDVTGKIDLSNVKNVEHFNTRWSKFDR